MLSTLVHNHPVVKGLQWALHNATLCDDMIGFSNRRLCGNSFHEYLNFV